MALSAKHRPVLALGAHLHAKREAGYVPAVIIGAVQHDPIVLTAILSVRVQAIVQDDLGYATRLVAAPLRAQRTA